MEWKKESWELFQKILTHLPQFHRTIAQKLVKETAEKIAFHKNKEFVEEEDLIYAFFEEVPPAFKGMMERLFTNLGIDYKKFVK